MTLYTTPLAAAGGGRERQPGGQEGQHAAHRVLSERPHRCGEAGVCSLTNSYEQTIQHDGSSTPTWEMIMVTQPAWRALRAWSQAYVVAKYLV